MALGLAARKRSTATPRRARLCGSDTRARDLLDETVPAKEQLAVLYGLFAVTIVRGEYAAARLSSIVVPRACPCRGRRSELLPGG